MSEYNIYRLKGGAKPKGWQLPLKDTFVTKFVTENNLKKSVGGKRIVYVEGSDSIYAEDQKGDMQPQQIWFDDGEIRARKDNLILNKILEKHPWNGTRYELWSREAEENDELKEMRVKAEARKAIDDTNPDNMKAIALAVFGVEGLDWTPKLSEINLRKMADAQPTELIDRMSQKSYESNKIAALAFTNGVVTQNNTKNAVVWSDSQGVILKLAKGENGIMELGRFLGTATEDSTAVLQSIGDRLTQVETGTTDKDVVKSQAQEIAELKAKLAEVDKVKKNEANEGEKALEAVRKEYAKVVGEVPVNMKNNAEWLQGKIDEAKDASKSKK